MNITNIYLILLKKLLIFISATLFSTHLSAEQAFKIVVGLSKPPYVIKENMSGFELEVVQQVFKISGKKIEFIFVPYGRSEKMLELDDISAVMTINKQMFPNSTSLSENYINYQNVAITLKKNSILLPNISTLANYTVASFQLAHKVLGQEFADAMASSPMFTQVADQEKQVELLLLGRMDVVVMDIKIFLYYLNKLNIAARESDVTFHHIFPVSPYRMAFKHQDDMAEFNRALAKFKDSASYQKLIKKYAFN